MTITLRAVTHSNYEDVCDLEVLEEQKEFVADNTWSIVEASFNPHYQTRAIYNDDELVGFIMWVPETDARVSIWRLMIHYTQQQKGYGKQAIMLAIEEIKQISTVSEIEVCYDTENVQISKFYQKLGFVEEGMDEDGDDMLAVLKV
ncbi:GNAT family N-acetyltransferase [Rheinheimera aquimaris]|uniref:GNAT family N-acetyltransferase n=1 Tax=Rheinheimera aquimaris TaxID=412437 RepID=UPI00106639E4|nr:GNAT family N-acetyltransferase [Rheinheimera aquimaris]